MAESTRRIVAIVFTDIAGFTELSARNESAAIALIQRQRELFQPKVAELGGTWLKEMGDGLLLSFDSSLVAVNCAVELQHLAREVEGLNLRIGIHIGDILIQGNDVFGDGVNIASRIEALAPVGGIALSKKTQLDLISHPEYETASLGLADLKGVSEVMEVHCITSHSLPGPEAIAADSAKSKLKESSHNSSRAAWVVAGVACLAVVAMAVFVITKPEPEKPVTPPEKRFAQNPPTNLPPKTNAPAPASVVTNKPPEKVEPRPPLPDRSVVIRDFKMIGEHRDEVRSVAFGPKAEWLVSGGIDGAVKLWNLKSGKPAAFSMSHTDEINCVSFSVDGTRIISGGDDNRAIIWSTATGAKIHELKHSGAVWGVDFGPRGKVAATVGRFRDVYLWDAATGVRERTLTSHRDTVYCVTFDSRGAWLASGSDDNQVILWKTADGLPFKTIDHHTDSVWGVAFSRDNRWLATSSDDRTAVIWNLETFKPAHILKGVHVEGVNWVTFSPDSSRLVTAGEDGPAIVWSVKTGEKLFVLEGFDGLWSADFSPDGKKIATAGFDNAVRLWEIP